MIKSNNQLCKDKDTCILLTTDKESCYLSTSPTVNNELKMESHCITGRQIAVDHTYSILNTQPKYTELIEENEDLNNFNIDILPESTPILKRQNAIYSYTNNS